MTDERKQRVAALFSLISEDYDQSGVEFFATFGAALVEFAELRPGEHVLDVGCGRGAVTFPAAEAVGVGGFVEAIDIAPGMVERLRVDAEQRGVGNVAIRVGDAEAPGVEEGSFDAVLASLVLFFLPDLDAALRAYRSALRSGGRLAFTTFGETSATWSAIEQRIASFLPNGHPLREQAGRPQTGPLASQDAIRGSLTGAGYTDIVSEERQYPVRYGTGADLVRWSHTTGLRAIWDAIPADRRPDAETQVAAMADALRDDAGELAEPVRIVLTRAISA
ncbi:MAG TPA: methyltransferase domain-containing protein [Gaiellales bacterium]|nr:methyltransferase domain-containing protein [Gaiellales bacterium]